MEKTVPVGHFNLTLYVPLIHLDAIQNSKFVATHGITRDEIFIYEESQKQYAELELVDADIFVVVSELVALNVEADLDISPLYEHEHYGNVVAFNAFVRHTENGTESFINTKDNENQAYELTDLLRELHDNEIHEADQFILKRINTLHSLGWVI